MQMKTIIILVSLLAAISLAAAYTPEQQVTVDGVRLSFQLGQSQRAVVRGIAPAEHVEIDSVQDEDAHVGSVVPGAPRSTPWADR